MHSYDSIWQDPTTWVAVAFTLFFVLFGKKLVTALLGVLDKRSLGIRHELDEAARLRSEAEAMLAAATEQREAAMRDAAQMLEQARTEAQRLAETARADAETTAARREKMALGRIGAAEKAAITDVRVAAAEIAGRAAELVLADGFSAADDAALIDRAIQGLPAALASRRAA